jgi:protein required for attachment to host cells
MSQMWIVVANSSLARIMSAPTPDGPLVELECLSHTAGRMLDQQLVSDRPGRSHDAAGVARHAMESEVTPKQEEAIRFADHVAATLRKAHAAHEFDYLAIVAAPRFLGLLRERIGPAVTRTLTETVDKDLAMLSPAEIRGRLPERLYSDR